MKSISIFLLLLLHASVGLADGSWQTQISNKGFVGISYDEGEEESGYPSFTAAVESLAKSGDISRLSTVDITYLMSVDRELDKELKTMLQKGWPDEFKAAQRSSGNMHNPALDPIYRPVVQCLLQTSLMKEIVGALDQQGLVLEPVYFEKFQFVERNGFRPFWGFAYLRVEPSKGKKAGEQDAAEQPAFAAESE